MAVTVDDVRAALRRCREESVGSREKLEEKSGVDQSTIYRAETDPTYFFQIDTFIRLIEGMQLSFSEFFARIEGVKGTRAHEEASVSAPDVEIYESLAAFVQELSAALAHAVGNARARQSTPETRGEETDDGSRRA